MEKEKVYVARRFDKSPNIEIRFFGYKETVRSKAFELDGVIAPTMFCKDINTHRRLLIFGWKDCTNLYYNSLENKEEPKKEEKVTKKKTRGRPKTKRK